MPGDLLRAEDLACVRGGRPVFANLWFELAATEVLVLRGPNGSGKSSLLRLLAGFLEPAIGRLFWGTAPIDPDLASHRTRVHFIGHVNGIKTALTAAENLSFAIAATGGDRGRVDAALARFALTELADLPSYLLSAGQRRRLALARLVAASRPLWLLDEPAVGLDDASRATLSAALAEHRAGGGIAVLATHGDLRVADALVLDLNP